MKFCSVRTLEGVGVMQLWETNWYWRLSPHFRSESWFCYFLQSSYRALNCMSPSIRIGTLRFQILQDWDPVSSSLGILGSLGPKYYKYGDISWIRLNTVVDNLKSTFCRLMVEKKIGNTFC